jgi:hypothetical protein
MKRKSLWAALLSLAIVVILALAAAPAGAIVGGAQTGDDLYSNVGLVVQMGAFVEGAYGFSGSCTLVRNDPPDNVVVLCAAHQLVGWAATDNYVTFEALPDFGWVWTDDPSKPVGIGGAVTYPVKAQAYPSTYVFTWSPSKVCSMGPGQEDIALMWLDTAEKVTIPGTDGVEMPTTPIVGLNGLGADLKSETFTAVGYGLTGWLRGNVMSFLHGGASATMWNGRNYREDISVITEHGVFSDRYLQVTFGESQNDSGGPLLRGDTIVAVTSTGAPGVGSGSYDYRLDTQTAQDFLNEYLDKGPPEQPQ